MATWEFLIIELPAFEVATHAPGASAAVHALNAGGERGWEAVGMTRLLIRVAPYFSKDPNHSRSGAEHAAERAPGCRLTPPQDGPG